MTAKLLSEGYRPTTDKANAQLGYQAGSSVAPSQPSLPTPPKATPSSIVKPKE